MLNTLQLVGRLADSPQSTETPTGRTAATFRLAVPRRPVNGEDRGAVFVDVECWGTLAETVARYLQRGRLVAVSGRLEQDEWHHDGARRGATPRRRRPGRVPRPATGGRCR